jgi:protease-4
MIQFFKKRNQIIFVQISGNIPTSRGIQEIMMRKPTFSDIIRFVFDKGKEVKGVFLDVSPSNLSLSEIWELKRVITLLRQQGVKVLCYIRSGGIGEIFLASACDRVIAPENSEFFLTGFSATINALGGFFKKIGIEIETIKSGKLKSIPDILTKEFVPEYIKKDVERFLSEIKDALISETEKFNPDVYFSGILKGKDVLSCGIVDEISDSPTSDIIKREFGDCEIVYPHKRFLQLPFGREKRIALVNMNGIIGDSPSPNFINPYFFSELLLKLADNSSVEAVILRINSRGGDANGSHMINEKVEYMKRKKRVFVSFSSVGASGGYLMGVSANKIFSTPFSAIGSIGVFMVKPFLGKLLKRVGIDTQIVSFGEYSDIFSPYKKLSQTERKILENFIKEEHEAFIKKVADGRGLSIAHVKNIANGSVFSGIKTKELNLVDDFKSLPEIIYELSDGKFQVQEFPKFTIYDFIFPGMKMGILKDLSYLSLLPPEVFLISEKIKKKENSIFLSIYPSIFPLF